MIKCDVNVFFVLYKNKHRCTNTNFYIVHIQYISRRNVPNPDKPLYDFLESVLKDPADFSWVSSQKIALPNKTMSVADVVLISLRDVKRDLTKLNNYEKSQMVKCYMSDSDFMEKFEVGFEQAFKLN